eukprot:m.232745 g.232745  ORF g.232745 m.232745 type:complete len:306 (-) comp22448_c1_seq2:580-1497(-)
MHGQCRHQLTVSRLLQLRDRRVRRLHGPQQHVRHQKPQLSHVLPLHGPARRLRTRNAGGAGFGTAAVHVVDGRGAVKIEEDASIAQRLPVPLLLLGAQAEVGPGRRRAHTQPREWHSAPPAQATGPTAGRWPAARVTAAPPSAPCSGTKPARTPSVFLRGPHTGQAHWNTKDWIFVNPLSFSCWSTLILHTFLSVLSTRALPEYSCFSRPCSCWSATPSWPASTVRSLWDRSSRRREGSCQPQSSTPWACCRLCSTTLRTKPKASCPSARHFTSKSKRSSCTFQVTVTWAGTNSLARVGSTSPCT